MWTNFFDKIYCINLPKRVDRLLQFVEEMEKYEIEFEIVNGIEHESGAEGLRQTVEKLFIDAIEKKYNNILIFEDDCYFVEGKSTVDWTMENAIKELPEQWHILYLSAQPTNGFNRRQSGCLLQLDGAFATHSWAISNQGMREILSAGLDAPIDNSIVKSIQPLQKCFITYPLLTSQRESFSDIGKTVINWHTFIVDRYNQKLGEI
jgi:GR25 family glycosyltransferase involved in LPS biosynthesis